MSQNEPQPPPASRPTGLVQIWADTHPGKAREANEDHVYPQAGASRGPIRLGAAKMSAKGHLAIVADGVGGAQVGSRVSERAVQYVSDGYYDGEAPDPGINLRQAVESANHWLHDLIRRDPAYSRAATTLTAAVILDGTLHVAHVGDSRAYLVRSGEISQLTKDHTLAQEKFDSGHIGRREEIPHDPGHSVLTRSLAIGPQVQVDMIRQTLKPRDTVVLCSDGLYDEVRAAEIRAVVEREDPKKAVKTLIRRANQAGGHDNVSVAVMRFSAGAPAAASTPLHRTLVLVLSVAILAMVAALAAIVGGNLLDRKVTLATEATALPTPPLPSPSQTDPVATTIAFAAATNTALTTAREPTSTSIPEAAPTYTPEPTKTAARAATWPPPVAPVRSPTPTATPNRNAPPAPILTRPEAGVELSSEWRFEWQWNYAALPAGQAFDLLIWSEKETDLPRDSRSGAITPWQETWVVVDVSKVKTVEENGEGIYYWTVIVVEVEPYRRIGQWGEERPFSYRAAVAPVATPTSGPTPTNAVSPEPPAPTDIPSPTPTPAKTPGATATPTPATTMPEN